MTLVLETTDQGQHRKDGLNDHPVAPGFRGAAFQIPIFYIPIDDEASVLAGVDPDLNPITLPADLEEPPYPLLSLNFNEESPLLEQSTDRASTSMDSPQLFQDPDLWEKILNFNIVSPAYANDFEGHPPCYHTNLIAPVDAITIENDHEPGWNKPEIMLSIEYEIDHPVASKTLNLKKVDKVDTRYTQYADRKIHGSWT